jgi:hypothetical protein
MTPDAPVVEPVETPTNRDAMLAKLADLEAQQAKAVAGGG